MSNVNVETEAEFDEWYRSITEGDQDSVAVVVDMLEIKGLTLPYPWSSAINGATFALRELRVNAGRSSLRVFYAFDEERKAVVLLGGDKAGDNRFYAKMTKKCEAIWKRHKAGMCQEE